MRMKVWCVVCAILLLSGIATATTTVETQITSGVGDAQLAFTPNQGQWDEEIQYRVNGNGATMWITVDGVYFQFNCRMSNPKSARTTSLLAREDARALVPRGSEPEPVATEVVRLDLVSSNRDVRIEPQGELGYYTNYFLGNDPARWRSEVPSYKSIVLHDVYDGISLQLVSRGSAVEYQFLVAPGADASQIMLRFEGIEELTETATGELVARTKLGTIAQSSPTVRQNSIRGSIDENAPFQLRGERSFGFDIPASIDQSRAFTIDPVFTYSTFLGGSSTDEALSIDVSPDGYAFVTGHTYSSDFPTISHFDSTFNGNEDVFVTKLDTDGSSLIYSTYIGGSGNELGRFIDEDQGEVALTGYTQSSNFPLSNAYDNTLGGVRDAFVIWMNSTGTGLIFSTYLGGSSSEDGFGVYFDPSLKFYCTGWTSSSDFPTASAYDATYNGGSNDAFVTAFGSLGSLIFSTYLGGSGSEIGWEIKKNGGVYVAGSTSSSNFPTASAYDASYNGGTKDCFVTQLSSNGSSLTYSTYVGGSGQDEAIALDVSSSGVAYFTGLTSSSNYPTVAASDSTLDGTYDAPVTAVAADGASLIYSTLVGGSSHDYCYELALTSRNQPVICGRTESSDLPVSNPVDNSYGGSIDAFVARIGTQLSYNYYITFCTYLGGSGQDLGLGVAVDAECRMYAAGSTQSSDFPTANAYDASRNGTDAFVTKISQFTCSDLNGDGIGYSVADLIFLIYYLYYGGPAPCPLEAGDFDQDGDVDMADYTAYYNWFTYGGVLTCPSE